MGLFGESSNSNDDPEYKLDQQFKANQAELEAKKASLYKTRLDIIKGGCGQRCEPDKTSPVGNKSIGNAFPFGGSN